MLPTLTPAGIPLIQPKAEKSARTMTRKAFKHFVHEMEQARLHHGLLLRFVCAECQTPVALRRGDVRLTRPEREELEASVNVDTDAFTLVCACSIVTVDA